VNILCLRACKERDQRLLGFRGKKELREVFVAIIRAEDLEKEYIAKGSASSIVIHGSRRKKS